ncbi:obscurin-like [Spodoptera litura]|uniref:Obscurin-like n=1 Tax=Spodoptera litura TaxID=69820 RepID=A0A9J7E853_SPOLT|nr:obscurin-like [Spodoptera litura]XP_022824918.1 obscurin-like [Spodoptera litura]XP_022824919.1 obscurin-like [Spodoptera litura]
MCAAATLLLMAALPALAGQGRWCADGEVVALEGAGPAFAPQQHTAVLAPAGHAATLDCRVLRLRDKSVSWVRSRDLQILSHAGTVFTADARVSAAAAGARHSLRIERLRTTDAGRYECQVNTEPKMSLFFNLTVVDEPVPEVVVSVLGAAGVTARAGGAATLACQARYEPPPRQLPLPDLDIRWQKGNLPISLQSGRGVALDTQRWAARVESRLTLAALRADDAGHYSCSAAGRAATLTLDIDRLADDDRVEAMQRDQEAARGRGAPAAGVLAGGALSAGARSGVLLAIVLLLR